MLGFQKNLKEMQMPEGQKPIAITEFDIEIPRVSPDNEGHIFLPDDPVRWIELMRTATKESGGIYINIRSILADQVQITINPYTGQDKDCFGFEIEFETLDQLKRAIDFVHQEVSYALRTDKVSPTAPK
jgi:hypothetical protein